MNSHRPIGYALSARLAPMAVLLALVVAWSSFHAFTRLAPDPRVVLLERAYGLCLASSSTSHDSSGSGTLLVNAHCQWCFVSGAPSPDVPSVHVYLPRLLASLLPPQCAPSRQNLALALKRARGPPHWV